MATQKPISTISYNTEPFLKEKLDTWLQAHIIQAYQYIPHKGEDGDKDHIHLRIEPNKKLDPMDLSESLKEYEKGKEKPLGVRPWRQSKEEDWFLYAVHDKDYLALKYGGGEKGEKLPYDYTDIKVSEGYDLEIAFTRARARLKHTSANLITRMKGGESPSSLITSGENVFMVNALMRSLNMTEYERVREANNALALQLRMLYNAVKAKGFDVIDQGGFYELQETTKEETSKSKKARKKLVLTEDDEWMPIPEDNPLTDE